MQEYKQGQQPKKLPHWFQRLKLTLGKGLKKTGKWWHAKRVAEKRLLLTFAVLLIVGCMFSSLGLALSRDWSSLWNNLGTGLFGSAVTLFFIDILVGNKEKQEAKEQEEAQLKADLVARFGSSVRNVAIAASEELRRRGWLYDGLLQGENLPGANLAGAILSKADLQKAILNDANLQNAVLVLADLQSAHLDGCNLQGANLLSANLQKARLVSTKLQGANLREANLQDTELFAADLRNAQLNGANLRGAYLYDVNLEGAELRGANLQGANLFSTNLRGADLRRTDLEDMNLNEIDFDENTILPDGSRWTVGIDVTTFTRKIR